MANVRTPSQRGVDLTDSTAGTTVDVPAKTIADPGPLGLAAFATTTLVLSFFNAGILKASLESTVFSLALFYGGAVQVLAGMWEFRKGNTFGATAFASYGAFWMSFWGLNKFLVVPARIVTTKDVSHAVATFLLAWTIFTLYMTIASFGAARVIAGVFVLLSITFVLLTIGKWTQTGLTATGLTKTGGWFGIATALAAFYGSAAGVTNATWGRTVLPMLPKKAA